MSGVYEINIKEEPREVECSAFERVDVKHEPFEDAGSDDQLAIKHEPCNYDAMCGKRCAENSAIGLLPIKSIKKECEEEGTLRVADEKLLLLPPGLLKEELTVAPIVIQKVSSMQVSEMSEDITRRNAQNCKKYYYSRKKSANQGVVKKNTNSEKCRQYRQRKKLLAQLQSKNEVIHTPSTSSLQMTFEPQLITTGLEVSSNNSQNKFTKISVQTGASNKPHGPPYQKLYCTVCSKLFLREETLKNHMRVHFNPMQSSCDICKKTFAKQHHVGIHDSQSKELNLETNIISNPHVHVIQSVDDHFDKNSEHCESTSFRDTSPPKNGKIGRTMLNSQARDIISRVYDFMKKEAKALHAEKLTDARWRTAQAVGVSERTITRILGAKRNSETLSPLASEMKKKDAKPKKIK